MPEIGIVWKSVSWLLGPRFGKYVKVVSDAPGEFLAGLDAHIDIGFGTDGGANGPEDQFRQRPVGGLADAGVRHGVLYADVVVLRRVAVTFQRGVYRLAFLQLLEVSQLSAAGFGEPFEIGRGAHREGELDGELGPGGPVVDYVEIVFVDAGLNGFDAGVLEAVLQHQLRLARGQADGLLIDVGVARRVAQFLGELDAIGKLVDGPLSGIGNLVGLELLEGALFGLADRADADLDEALAGLHFVVAEAQTVGEKLLHRAQDAVVAVGIVVVEPLAEVVVALEFEAGDLAGPVEAGGAID